MSFCYLWKVRKRKLPPLLRSSGWKITTSQEVTSRRIFVNGKEKNTHLLSYEWWVIQSVFTKKHFLQIRLKNVFHENNSKQKVDKLLCFGMWEPHRCKYHFCLLFITSLILLHSSTGTAGNNPKHFSLDAKYAICLQQLINVVH